MKKKILALVVSLALLLSATACGRIVKKPDPEPAPSQTEDSAPAAAFPVEGEDAAPSRPEEDEPQPAQPEEGEEPQPEEGEAAGTPEEEPEPENSRTGYFQTAWHGDAAFSELEYEHYESERFDALTEPIYDLARQGGTAEALEAADAALCEELYYIYTLQTLAELSFADDPSDDVYYEELSYTRDLFYAAYDEYQQAMHVLAVSPHKGLMQDYPPELIQSFAAYVADDGSAAAAYSEKNSLIQDYYREMAKPQPDYEAIGSLYVELVVKNNATARAAGYDNYADYAYDSDYYRDYAPADAEAVWDGVKRYIVPLMEEFGYDAWRDAQALEYARDLDYDSETILAAMDGALADLSPEMHEAFLYMREHGLYNIDYDPNKESTGYTTLLYSVNEPFIFNAPYGNYQDYTDMFHEFGHFTNFFYTESDLLYGLSDYDLSELQSQGLELIFTHYYPDIFGRHAGQAERTLLMNMVYSIIDGSLYDEFQQRVYREENLTPERVKALFTELYEGYGYLPYEGCEYEWMEIAHNFEYPFYYISYGVSALGALELYSLAQTDWDAAADKYLTACAMDTEAWYFSEAIAELGLGDVFAPATYQDVAQAIRSSFR